MGEGCGLLVEWVKTGEDGSGISELLGCQIWWILGLYGKESG